jgi:(R)-2-hydroxyacyl-CoA dehydratese activating ATPase
MICAGIDAGSRTIKVLLLDGEKLTVLGSGVIDQGIEQETLAERLLLDVLKTAGIQRDDVASIVATGYGRKLIHAADSQMTEITCQAQGVSHCLPGTRTVIDIGGQDSKLLQLLPTGKVSDFTMNDRCAAGTGRFLEMVATQLGVHVPDLGEMAGRSNQPAQISSMCVVFAETEIIGLLAQECTVEDIAAGIQASIAQRIHAMGGLKATPPVVFTGGVALVPTMDAALSTALGHPVTVAPDPQLTCALGAAIVAAKRFWVTKGADNA